MKRAVIFASLAVTLAFIAIAAMTYSYTAHAAMSPLAKIMEAISAKP